LLGIENKEQKPYAEYWLGAHPNHPSKLMNSQHALNQLIHTDAEKILGSKVAQKFGSLPYLLKILDVRQMLSIQVHPSIASAIKGYKEENDQGIALTASNRNYKDENHKPELMVALGDFWLLHGFKEENRLFEILRTTPELNFLMEHFQQKGYQGLYEKVMSLPQEEVNRILDPLIKRIIPLYQNGQLQKNQEDFWAARAALTFCKNNDYDRGIFSVYFFNLLHLKEGEGIYQPAGMPHAYLEGQNVEIMANSDNVLRAGLTDKHIDVPELMKHVRFEATHPKVLSSDILPEKIFFTPAEEFELHEYKLAANEQVAIETRTGEMWILTEGQIAAREDGQEIELEKGRALFAEAGSKVTVDARLPSVLFRATVPVL
jgi:mannose-6-phosphate isomerase